MRGGFAQPQFKDPIMTTKHYIEQLGGNQGIYDLITDREGAAQDKYMQEPIISYVFRTSLQLIIHLKVKKTYLPTYLPTHLATYNG